MRVLHVISSLDPKLGGPAKVVSEVFDLLPKYGVDVTIASSCSTGVSIGSSSKYRKDIELFNTLKTGFSFGDRFALSFDYLRWLVKNVSEFDVIHFHGLFDSFAEFGMLICRQRGVPYVSSPWGLLGTWALQQSKWRKTIFRGVLTNQNLRDATLIQFSTERELAEAGRERVPVQRSFVLPAGIHPDDFSGAVQDYFWQQIFGANRNRKRLLFLSRLHPKKNLLQFLRVLILLKTELDFIVAGTGESQYESECRQLVSASGYDHCVKFVGHVTGMDKKSLLKHADIFVLPSLSESQGIAVLEAVVSGCYPLVGKDVAMADVLSEHGYGRIHDYSDDSIATALRGALSEAESLANREHFAGLFLRRYSWNVILPKQVDYYRLATSSRICSS